MEIEIERKFRLEAMPEAGILGKGVPLLQGYLSTGKCEIRVRHFGNEYHLTVKDEGTISRPEWDKRIPRWVFEALWPYTEGRRIEKTRYSIPFGDMTLEVDEYKRELQGLLILECEFPDEQTSQHFSLPTWAKDAIEVTHDRTYKNKYLAEHGLRSKIYIASNLGFSEVGRDFYYKKLVPAIQQLGYEVIDPWKLTSTDKVEVMPYGPERRDAWRQLNREIGENNRKAIDTSSGLVAVLDGADVDSGTAAEIGYAFAKGKPILGYRSDFRLCSDNEGAMVNLQVEYFIRESSGTIVDEIAKLQEGLKKIIC